MTSPDPVPLPLGPLTAIVTTEGMTLSATEVTGQALAVDVDADAEVTGLTLDPDDCVAPTMRPPTTPPRPAQTRAPPTVATGVGFAHTWTRPKRPLSGPLSTRRPSERTPRWRDYRTAGNSTIFNSRAWTRDLSS